MHQYWGGGYHHASVLGRRIPSCISTGEEDTIMHQYWGGGYHHASVLGRRIPSCISTGEEDTIMHQYWGGGRPVCKLKRTLGVLNFKRWRGGEGGGGGTIQPLYISPLLKQKCK